MLPKWVPPNRTKPLEVAPGSSPPEQSPLAESNAQEARIGLKRLP